MGNATPPYRDRNLQLIFVVTLFAVMGVASIAPAFPQIIRVFDIGEEEIGWLVASFTLPGVLLAPVMGILADRVGRKNILIPSLVLFGIAGFSCIFVRDFNQLLVLRFFQGIGAASLGSLNITLIGDLYSGPERSQAMGYNASVLSIGTASYPALGGILTLGGWHYPFVLPILAIPMGIVVALNLRNPEPKSEHKLDTYLRNTWSNINQRRVWGLFLVNTLVFVLIYGAHLTYLPILLESRLQSSSVMIGLVMSLTSIATVAASAASGRMSRRLAPRRILITGIACYFAAMILYVFSFSYGSVVFPALLFGCGNGMIIPTVQTLLVGFAPITERAGFMSINGMVLRLGQTTGPMVVGFAYTLGGIDYVFVAGSIIAVTMAGVVMAMVRERPARRAV